ncbi:MAG: hypothetical protein Q7W29_05610 [bacterium]|nr:hypothetical protein [bacterium]
MCLALAYLGVGATAHSADAPLPEPRLAEELVPEDPLVLEWLKQLQDASSPGAYPLPSSYGDNEAQTFNNALAAMAFTLKGEHARARRILDFYARATDRDNQDPTLQNFFYKGEARGFYQHVRHHADGDVAALHTTDADRWIGDLAWLLLACEYHDQSCHESRYAELSGLIRDLLLGFYQDAETGRGGFIQHGWRRGDTRLHEDSGHHEGNIDCRAALRVCGRGETADRIGLWLADVVQGDSLPLDLYTWRVLAEGPEARGLMDIPESDPRYRKTLTVRGRPVTGFFHGPDLEVDNIWPDGTGHAACAYAACGDTLHANFYANQLDLLLITEIIGGVEVRGLPYAVNRTGGYQWVDPERGFLSAAAWYIFAKNRFNPLRWAPAR